MTRVEFGWLIRSIHSWSANLLIFVAFVHMFSVVFTHAYRRPRELTWLSGIALLGLMLGFGFSGYLLPWNQISYFATKVGTDVAGSTPFVGPVIARFLRGGEDVGAATLTRFFAFHVIGPAADHRRPDRLPPAAGAEARHEHPRLISRPQKLGQMKFFPNFFLRELMVWYGVLAVLGLAGRDLPLGTRRKGRPVRFRARRHPPRMVFPGAVLHPEADSRATCGSSRARLLGLLGFGALAWSGCSCPSGQARTRWHQPHPPGHRRRHLPGRLSVHLHLSGILQMRAPAILLLPPAWMSERSHSPDSCVTCHAARR